MNDLHRKSLIGDEFFSFTQKDLSLKLILLFPLTTLFQHHIGFLNKLLFAIVLVVFFMVNAVYKRPLLYQLFITATWIIAMLFTPMDALKLNVNMALYYIFLVFYFVFILSDREKVWDLLIKNRRYIYYIVLIYTLLLTLSIFLPSSYSQSESGGWGDEKYFESFSGSPNRVGPASVFVVVLIIFLISTGSHKALALLSLPQVYVFLMGGSRTYFVVGLCAILVLYYVMFTHKKWFYLSLIPMGIVFLILVLNSNMMEKFAATTQSGQGLSQREFWRRLTNTRSIFWVEQLKLFFNTPWYRQLIGNGINFTTHQYGLWAHSDFIEILCSYGYLGLFNYLALIIYTLRKLLRPGRKHFLIKCVCVFIWFFNAFINFFYCYFCSMLCYPILLLTIQHLDDPSSKTNATTVPKG